MVSEYLSGNTMVLLTPSLCNKKFWWYQNKWIKSKWFCKKGVDRTGPIHCLWYLEIAWLTLFKNGCENRSSRLTWCLKAQDSRTVSRSGRACCLQSKTPSYKIMVDSSRVFVLYRFISYRFLLICQIRKFQFNTHCGMVFLWRSLVNTISEQPENSAQGVPNKNFKVVFHGLFLANESMVFMKYFLLIFLVQKDYFGLRILWRISRPISYPKECFQEIKSFIFWKRVHFG